MSDALDELLNALDLAPVEEGQFLGTSARLGPLQSVFGGQLLAQMTVAADKTVPDKTVKSLHTIFVGPASLDIPLSFEVEVMHVGRMYASTSVSVRQEGRLCARALVLLDSPDVELAAHSSSPPDAVQPNRDGRLEELGAAEICVVDHVDLDDLANSGPPELQIWFRFSDAPDDDGVNRGLLAYASEPYFFGAALRPHQGLSSILSYTEIRPSVITHSVTFHGPVTAGQWHLMDISSPHLGRGRIFGQSSIFAEDGTFVASVTQENQLRPMRRP